MKGSGLETIILEAINNGTNENATIGEYEIDFDENTVTETNFEKELLRNLFAEAQTETEPDYNDDGSDDNSDYVDLNDEDFWNNLLNGY